ncbi:MAG: homoserine kinase, partial [Parvularculaceae bacterium]|nr:homoserine kinase [Parvularculaceae bacterium]
CARPIRTLAGERLTVLAGKPAALISFCSGRPNMTPTYEDAEKAGMTLAEFHLASRDFAHTRPNSMGPGSWRDMLKAADDRLDTFGAGLTKELRDTLELLRERWPSEIKRGTIHGDLFPDNLLLDHGDPTGLIDFYFACTDYLAYDLAIAMNAYLPEDGPLDVTNADAMFEGYNRVRPLGQLELEAMPTLLCGCALRFFLSRAVDALDESQSSVYTPKDPLPWLRLMRHHRHQMEAA